MASILPADFENKMKRLLENEWDDFLYCYDNDKYQGIRINPLKVNDKNIVLNEFQIKDDDMIPWEENGYYYDENIRPGKHPYHEMGLYYIQEPSAMSAVSLLNPKPGMRVLDLCAAPGGKSTQIAGRLMQDGVLVSNEINSGRAKILSQNIERLGIKNTIVTNEDSAKLSSAFPSFFHCILVDAPCSGEGMFRKNPIALDEWSIDNVNNCHNRQMEILENASRMLMPGGRLVYSTCTFSPEENEITIGKFIEEHDEFTIEKVECDHFSKGNPSWGNGNTDLENTFRLWPHKVKGEGHYVAVLKKAGVFADYVNNSNKKKNKKVDPLLDEFLSDCLNDETKDWIISGKLVKFKDNIYRIPVDAPPIDGLHILRAGLHIGEFKKNRFEPAYALGVALNKEEAKVTVELKSDDPRVKAYYRGESFWCENDEICGGKKGWALLTINGISAGWGKLSNGQFKNHYPKGLRKEL